MSHGKFNLRRLIAQTLESGKIGDEKITQEFWFKLVDLYAIITGMKPQQGHTVTVPKMKPRGRTAGINFDKIRKEEERRRKLALAEAAEETKQEVQPL